MAETRYISPKTGWKAKPLQAAGDNGDFLQTDVPPKGLACARSLSRYDQLIEGLTVQRERANRGQTEGKQVGTSERRNRQKIDKRCQT